MTKAIDIALELQHSRENIANTPEKDNQGNNVSIPIFSAATRKVPLDLATLPVNTPKVTDTITDTKYDFFAPWEKDDTAPAGEERKYTHVDKNTPQEKPTQGRPEHFSSDYVNNVIKTIPDVPEGIITPSFTAYVINDKDYARATGVIDHRVTSNDFKKINLKEWQEDCLISGFAQDPSLMNEFISAQAKKWGGKEKRAIKKQAKALGGAEDGSNYGSLIHAIMESWAAHPDKLAVFYKTLPAYLCEALMENIDLFTRNGLEIVSSENIVIISENPPIAGTFDNIVKNKDGEMFIHDYKSTKTSSLQYSYDSYALQMFMYAQAKNMVTKTGEIVTKPEVNQDYGYLTHTPLDGPAQMLLVGYRKAKEELPVVMESFAAQYARDQKIQEIHEKFKDYQAVKVL